MPRLRVPALLKYYLQDQTELPLEGETVQEALQHLTSQYPQMTPHLFDPAGRLRRHINIFLNQENIRTLQGLQTPLRPEDTLKIVPSVTGG
jgi:molybdopterin converting factor small subunit